MSCSQCGSPLTRIEYQSRSADEPQTLMVRCPLCPVDISKFFQEKSEHHVHLTRIPRKPWRLKRTSITNTVTRNFICAKTRLPKIKEFLSSPISKENVYISTVLSDNSTLFKFYYNGKWSREARSILSTVCICPNIHLTKVSIAKPDNVSSTKTVSHTSVETEHGLYDVLGEHVSIWFEVSDNSEIGYYVDLCYTIGFCPSSLRDMIPDSTLKSILNLSSRAYDKYSVPDYEYMFSTKPDGERYWLVRLGCVWFYMKKSTQEVSGWEFDDTIEEPRATDVGPLVDIELMLGFKPILIDILMDDDSCVSSSDRDITKISSTFNSIRSKLTYLHNIQEREFFDTISSAKLYKDSVGYPVDGMVALSKTSVDMFKLKSEKSMELVLVEDCTMETDDGIKVLLCEPMPNYEPGTILEVRFEIKSFDIKFLDMFHRPDKTKANDSNSVFSIIQSCFNPVEDSSNIVRTELWRWSNSLRSFIYSIVQRQVKERSVILDIGTGSGQSTDVMQSMAMCSFILVEPDTNKCRQLTRRLNIRQFHTEPRSIIPMIGSLKNGSMKYCVLNCSLSNIISDTAVMKNLSKLVSHTVSCFSSQFVLKELDTLSSLGINSVGCCYMYDGIKVGSSIIDSYGITMKRRTETECSVRWGTDKEYTEPYVTQESVPESMMAVRSLDLVPMYGSQYKDVTSKVLSHVYFLRSV